MSYRSEHSHERVILFTVGIQSAFDPDHRVRTAQGKPGKPGKRDFFEKKSGKTWKTQGIF